MSDDTSRYGLTSLEAATFDAYSAWHDATNKAIVRVAADEAGIEPTTQRIYTYAFCRGLAIMQEKRPEWVAERLAAMPKQPMRWPGGEHSSPMEGLGDTLSKPAPVFPADQIERLVDDLREQAVRYAALASQIEAAAMV